MLHSALLNVMIGAARKAARALKRDFGEVEKLQVSVKGPANFATAADRRAEETLFAELNKARPGYGFLGEEGGRREGADKTHTWIVDPLDGTTNFLHGVPHFCISIGLERDGALVAGVVYDPIADELFIAEKGKGAFLNDRRIRVAARRNLNEALIACPLPHLGRGSVPDNHAELARIQPHVAGLRRLGATALELAWVAAGRFDAYWDHGVSPWDLAAGIVLVREAGGYVSDVSGRDAMLAEGHIVAGNETMQRALLKMLKPVAES
jgi:myo-inositol-1(or 4)-monophosphatase